MPTYQYRCKSCGKTHDIEHGFHDERPTKCSSCGGQLVRVFHPVGVVFKGSGFHKTDYTSTGLRKEPAAASTGTDAGKGDSKTSDTKQTDAKAAPAKTESTPSTSTKPAATSSDSGSPPSSSKP